MHFFFSSFLDFIWPSQIASSEGPFPTRCPEQSWAVPACWAGCGALKWQRKGWGREQRAGGRMSLWWYLARCFLPGWLSIPIPSAQSCASPSLPCHLDYCISHSIPTLGHCSQVLGSRGRKQLRSQGAVQCLSLAFQGSLSEQVDFLSLV